MARVTYLHACAAVGREVVPVSTRLKQALQRSFESTFALYKFQVWPFGCVDAMLSSAVHHGVPYSQEAASFAFFCDTEADQDV